MISDGDVCNIFYKVESPIKEHQFKIHMKFLKKDTTLKSLQMWGSYKKNQFKTFPKLKSLKRTPILSLQSCKLSKNDTNKILTKLQAPKE